MTLALAQIPVAMGDKAANVRTILRYVEAAAAAGCDTVVFPECSLAGWCSPAARRAAETIPGPMTRRLGALARRHRMSIAIGLEERDGGRIYNSAVLIGPDGRLLARHRKVDELKFARRLYTTGQSLSVVGTTGLSICADSWADGVTAGLTALGAQLILSPSAWAIQPGREASNLRWILSRYRARTRRRPLTIVAANGVGPVTQGPWRGRILQGESLVVGPGGRVLLRGPRNREALLLLPTSSARAWTPLRGPSSRPRRGSASPRG